MVPSALGKHANLSQWSTLNNFKLLRHEISDGNWIMPEDAISMATSVATSNDVGNSVILVPRNNKTFKFGICKSCNLQSYSSSILRLAENFVAESVWSLHIADSICEDTILTRSSTDVFPIVGNPSPALGLSWELAWHKGSTGTSEPDLARTSCCSLQWIAQRVPMSWLARTRG